MVRLIIKLLGFLASGLSGLYFISYLHRLVTEPHANFSQSAISASIAIVLLITGIELITHAGYLGTWIKARWERFKDREKVDNRRIRSEICQRILDASRQKDKLVENQEKVDTLLDALEEIVDLPREEMERIAETVRQEYNQPPPQTTKSTASKGQGRSRGRRDLWYVTGSFFLTYVLIRRGSPVYLATGAVFLVFLLKFLIGVFSNPKK